MHLPPLLIVGIGVMLDIGAAILCVMAQFAQSDKVKNESCREAIIEEVVETHWKIGVILFVVAHVYAGIVAFLCLMWPEGMHRIMKTYAMAFLCISCCTLIMGATLLGLGRKLKESSNGSCVTTHPNFLVFGGLVSFFGHGVLTFIGYLTTIRRVQEKFGDDSENANYNYKGHSNSP